MTLQALIDQLQALAHEGHAQEEVHITDFLTHTDTDIMSIQSRECIRVDDASLVRDVALYSARYIV